MKQKIKLFFRNLKRKIYRKRRNRELKYATWIRTFFEGYEGFNDEIEIVPPVIAFDTFKFVITKFRVKERADKVIIFTELKRPGIFIGRYGEQIDKLRKHLSTDKKKVEFRLTESKLFI